MSYIDISSLSPLSPSNQINYNYGPIDVQYSNSQYISTAEVAYNIQPPSGYSSVVPDNTYGVHISGFTPNSSSNVSYPNSTYTYKSSDIYIFPLIHKILNLSYDKDGNQINGIVGEFIIKHTSVSSKTSNIYLCFFLSNNLSALNLVSTNDVDNIINFIWTNGTTSGSIETILQYTLPIQNNAIQYSSSENKDLIFVFTNPINVNLYSSKFLIQLKSNLVDGKYPSFLLPIPPKDAVNLTTDNIKTANDDNIYMDCQPTGMSADEIKAYNVPINSEYTQNASKTELMTFAVQVSIIFAILVTSYFAVPRMYKWFIIDNINKFILNYEKKNKDDLDNNNTQNSREWVNQAVKLADGEKTAEPKYGIDTHIRIATVDILLTIFFWSFYFAIGFNGLSFDSVIIGIYFIIFYALSVSTIQFNKMSSDFMKTKIEVPGSDDEKTFQLEGFAYPTTQGTKEITTFFMYSDIISFFTDAVAFFTKDKKWFLSFLFVLLVFIGGAAVPIYLASTNNWKLDKLNLTETQKGTVSIIVIYSLLTGIIFYGILRMMRLTREEWNSQEKNGIVV
jgi:hypothetical protein